MLMKITKVSFKEAVKLPLESLCWLNPKHFGKYFSANFEESQLIGLAFIEYNSNLLFVLCLECLLISYNFSISKVLKCKLHVLDNTKECY